MAGLTKRKPPALEAQPHGLAKQGELLAADYNQDTCTGQEYLHHRTWSRISSINRIIAQIER